MQLLGEKVLAYYFWQGLATHAKYFASKSVQKNILVLGGGGGGGKCKIYIPEDEVQRRENFINRCMLGKVYSLHTVLPC